MYLSGYHHGLCRLEAGQGLQDLQAHGTSLVHLHVCCLGSDCWIPCVLDHDYSVCLEEAQGFELLTDQGYGCFRQVPLHVLSLELFMGPLLVSSHG